MATIDSPHSRTRPVRAATSRKPVSGHAQRSDARSGPLETSAAELDDARRQLRALADQCRSVIARCAATLAALERLAPDSASRGESGDPEAADADRDRDTLSAPAPATFEEEHVGLGAGWGTDEARERATLVSETERGRATGEPTPDRECVKTLPAGDLDRQGGPVDEFVVVGTVAIG